jgi:hypothetical protein
MSDDALVCFATVSARHDEPGCSYFVSARRFEWVSPLERRGVAPADYPGVPIQVRASSTGQRSVFVFVRGVRDADYTLLGQSAPAYSFGARGARQVASFVLNQVVPAAVLVRLGVLEPPPSASAIDDGLRRLGAEGVEGRLAVLRQLVEYWRGPLRSSDGFSAAEIGDRSLPQPLRWWLSVAGRRTDIFQQNFILGLAKPFALRMADDKLVFYVENQGVWQVATQPEGEDPPVWARINESAEPWVVQETTLSIALIHAFVLEAILNAPYGATASCVGREIVDWLAGQVADVPVPGFRLMGLPSRLLAAGGAFAVVFQYENLEEFDVYVGAKTEQALGFLALRPGIWADA